eukprot:UN1453
MDFEAPVCELLKERFAIASAFGNEHVRTPKSVTPHRIIKHSCADDVHLKLHPSGRHIGSKTNLAATSSQGHRPPHDLDGLRTLDRVTGAFLGGPERCLERSQQPIRACFFE